MAVRAERPVPVPERPQAKFRKPAMGFFLTVGKKAPMRDGAAMDTQRGASAAQSFHSECMAYLEHLRRTGREDYAFEDEYYFTMPAVSGSG